MSRGSGRVCSVCGEDGGGDELLIQGVDGAFEHWPSCGLAKVWSSIDIAEEIRLGIATQVCPWCEKGPFAMLAVHTNKVHGIDKWALRDLAGLTTMDALCSAEVSEKMRGAAIRNRSVEFMAGSSKSGSRKRWTSAGRSKTAANLTEWAQANPEQHREIARRNGANVAPATRARAAAAIAAANAEWWANASPDERRQRLEKGIHAPGVAVKRMASIAAARRPCGTRAAYGRGCRCAECVAANREYRRAHG